MTYKLSDVCTIKYGKDHKRLANGNIPVYGSGGVMRYADTALYNKKSVLIPRKGSLDNLFFVSEPFWTVDTLFYTEIDEARIIPEYLYYLLKTLNLAGMNVGTAVPSLTTAVLNEIQIEIPLLSEQAEISCTLQALDRRIENNNKINHHLERMAQAIFKSWFVDFEPFGGKTPHAWTDTNLEAITSLICRGIAPKYSDDTEQMIINQKCIRNHMIDLSLVRAHTPKSANEKWLQYGDLLINSTGEGTLGRTAPVWFNPHNLTVDSHVTIVRPADGALIFYVGLWGIVHEREIEALHTGSTGQTELPRDRVKSMALLLPDNDILEKFNRVLTPIADTLVSNQEENIRLIELRDTLLPRLMSGELSVAAICSK